MKRNIFAVLFLIAISVIGISFLEPAHAQNEARSNDEDRRMATLIKRLTDRSTDGLVQETMPDGSVKMDLQERFQNVPLAVREESGDISLMCVTSLGEANGFFGRDLESGESVPTTRTAADRGNQPHHEMTEEEYRFYVDLIDQAAKRRTESPNLATLNIVNLDGVDEGFNSTVAPAVPGEGGNPGTTLGEQRLALFNFAAQIWGAYLDSSVPTNVNSQFNALTPCSTAGGVLGSAGTINIHRDFANAQFAGTWHHAALANKLAGSDLIPGTGEINAQFNSSVDTGCLGAGTRFYYGLNNSTPGGTINLLVVLLHEMGHGLGFSSFASSTTGALNGGFPDVYTTFMYDQTTSTFWNAMSNAQRQASAINTNNVFWDGPNVRNASGTLTTCRDAATGRVQLFTPNPVQSGSSVSHFNSTCSPNLLMEPAINTGLPLTLDLTRQQMRDIGWYRDTTADMVPDTITNVAPSGTTLPVGSVVNITWTNTGGFARNVTIELSTDGGTTFPTTIATDTANTGSFTFTVPNTPTTQARFRVREHNFLAPLGTSAANVTFGGATPTPTSTPTATPTSTPTATPTATPTNTPTATPTATPTSTPTATPTSTPTSTPTATPTPGGGAGFEGDVAPRPSGDGSMTSTDVVQLRRFATTLDTINPAVNEFQRADCAPRSTFGDNVINAGDVVQGRRYATTLDPLTTSGGPTMPPPAEELAAVIGGGFMAGDAKGRALRLTTAGVSAGGSVKVGVTLDSRGGDVAAVVFTLVYDPAKLSSPIVQLSAKTPSGLVLTVNDTQPGRLTVLVDSVEAIRLSEIVSITFSTGADAAGVTPITFDARSLSVAGLFGETIAITGIDGSVRVNDRPRR